MDIKKFQDKLRKATREELKLLHTIIHMEIAERGISIRELRSRERAPEPKDTKSTETL